ncbi:hypothetical protein [Clostridium sp.]|uniref:hypothetical protein n=1 Tax=Clostridium sp. TaxID=1506 RepID=UPI001A599040|nr:hypothetical protein [Clostridium sp.]MBK5234058.1 hypothetical protein [Clostridium sp.]
MAKFLDLDQLALFADKIKVLIGNKVDKDGTKVLSDKNFSLAQETKLTNIEAEANKFAEAVDVVHDINYVATQENYTTVEKTKLGNLDSSLVGITAGDLGQVMDVTVGGISVINASKIAVVPAIPTKTSDISNDSTFQTKVYIDGADDIIDGKITDLTTQVNNTNSEKIMNLGIINILSSTDIQIALNDYMMTNYTRAPLSYEALIVTITDNANDKIKYLYSPNSSTWIDVGKAAAEIATATSTVKGIAKLYTISGANTDGAMSQAIVTSLLGGKQPTMAAITNAEIDALFV